MRQLASIKTINNLSPIEGRDRIMLATIDGWTVIVKKDEFQVGDKCIYIEIDSVLPEREEFEFLRSKNFRIKTMKMAGVISQGICFPLSILPTAPENYEVGQDVTDMLGIKQYIPTMDTEPEGDIQRTPKNPIIKYMMRFKWFRKLMRKSHNKEDFPSFLHKTDEVRIQNMPNILENKDIKWVATEKVDGQSGTFCVVRNKGLKAIFRGRYDFYVCSRNKRLVTPDNSTYWFVANKYKLFDAMKRLIYAQPGLVLRKHDWVCIQGECVGPGVQKNKYEVSEPDLYVFNLIYPSGRVDSVRAKEMVEGVGLKFVPIVDTDVTLPDTVEEVLDYAHGKSAIGPNLREGIVFRSSDGRYSFKAVDPLFLIKYDE